jgi:hypothetical protein
LVIFFVFWYIFTILVCCTKKNLATLPKHHIRDTILWSWATTPALKNLVTKVHTYLVCFVNRNIYFYFVKLFSLLYGRKQGCQMVCFQKKTIQIWVNFVGSCNARCWYILWTLGPFYSLLLYFMDIWYSSWKFGIFIPV